MVEPVWLDLETVLKIHELILNEFGGMPGIRDLGLLESALSRAQWICEFDSEADLHGLGAAYAFGIAKNHPFVDGNKRVGYLSAYTFLRYNRWHVAATQADAVRAMVALASSGMGEADFAVWLREHSEPVEPS
jgi:death on curing protein